MICDAAGFGAETVATIGAAMGAAGATNALVSTASALATCGTWAFLAYSAIFLFYCLYASIYLAIAYNSILFFKTLASISAWRLT